MRLRGWEGWNPELGKPTVQLSNSVVPGEKLLCARVLGCLWIRRSEGMLLNLPFCSGCSFRLLDGTPRYNFFETLASMISVAFPRFWTAGMNFESSRNIALCAVAVEFADILCACCVNRLGYVLRCAALFLISKSWVY
jgi:hypothetical protein